MYYSPLFPHPAMSSAAIKMDKPQEKNEELPPIQLHSRRLACQNTVFSVFLDHVTGTHGHEVLQYLSVLPKCGAENMVTGVGVLPVKDGKLGLIRVFRHPLSRWSWEIPRGLVDAGETAEQAALRELREEMGFSILQAHLDDLGFTAPEPGLIKGRIKLFSAMLSGTPVGAVEGELGHGETKFFDRHEIADFIATGQIEDSSTLSSLLLYFVKEEGWLDSVKSAGSRFDISGVDIRER